MASTIRSALVVISAVAMFGTATAAASATVEQTNLVTDSQEFLTSLGFSSAATVDPLLINPWGMSYGPTGPFWVSNQGSDTSTLYNGSGGKVPLTVNIPHSTAGPHGPTGQVFNDTSGFVMEGGSKAVFLFANLDGSISGWAPSNGTTAQRVVRAGDGGRPAVYTGLAIGAVGADSFLYAANELTGHIDVFNSAFAPTSLAGNFVDPGPNPDNLRPFNIQALGGQLYVAYAVAGQSQDEAALGQGFVSVFNSDGTFVRRIAEGGPLSSPWGMAIAPAGFNGLDGALLVGNFSENFGTINAFRLSDGKFLGSLRDRGGAAVVIPYLWALLPGNGGNGGAADQLYFSAGIGEEEHGLFGTFGAVPEPATWATTISGLALVGAALRRRKRTNVLYNKV